MSTGARHLNYVVLRNRDGNDARTAGRSATQRRVQYWLVEYAVVFYQGRVCNADNKKGVLMDVIVPADHALASRFSIKSADLQNELFVSFHEN